MWHIKSIVAVSLLAVAVVSTAVPAQDQISNLKIAQVHHFTAKTLEGLEGEIVGIKKAGFNAISIRLFQNLDDQFHGLATTQKEAPFTGVYFQTEHAPLVYDMLSPVLEISARHDLLVFGWLTSRTMHWLQMPEATDMVYDPLDRTFARPASHYDLFNEQFLDYSFSLFSDLARSGIAGIIVQDDLVIKTREGLTETALQGFAIEEKIAQPAAVLRNLIHSDSKLFDKWSVYRKERVLQVISRFRRLIVQENNLLFGINIYPDTVIRRKDGLHWLAQDIYALAPQQGEFLLFMAYFSQLARELEITEDDAAALTEQLIVEMQQRFGQHLIVKYQIRDWLDSKALSPELFVRFAKYHTALALAPVKTGKAELDHAAEILQRLCKENE